MSDIHIISTTGINENYNDYIINQYLSISFTCAYVIKSNLVTSSSVMYVRNPLKHILLIEGEKTVDNGKILLQYTTLMNDFVEKNETGERIANRKSYSNFYYIKRLDIDDRFIINKMNFFISSRVSMMLIDTKRYFEYFNINYELLLKNIKDYITTKSKIAGDGKIKFEYNDIRKLFEDENILNNKTIGNMLKNLHGVNYNIKYMKNRIEEIKLNRNIMIFPQGMTKNKGPSYSLRGNEQQQRTITQSNQINSNITQLNPINSNPLSSNPLSSNIIHDGMNMSSNIIHDGMNDIPSNKMEMENNTQDNTISNNNFGIVDTMNQSISFDKPINNGKLINDK